MIGNQRLQRQFDGLLMMGIIAPETFWAVSVRQSNKILQLIVASSWVFLFEWQIFRFRQRVFPHHLTITWATAATKTCKLLHHKLLYNTSFSMQYWNYSAVTCPNSSVGTVAMFGLDNRGIMVPGSRKRFLFSPQCPGRLWGPTQPHIQGASGVLQPKLKRVVLRLTAHIQLG